MISDIPPTLSKALAVPLYQDEHVMVVNKPAGIAVHAGSGVKVGVIDVLRHQNPQLPYLELAHRLDRETSGCLLLAKSRQALAGLQAQFKGEQAQRLEKSYLAVVSGAWQQGVQSVSNALDTIRDSKGMKRVVESPEGRLAKSVLMPVAVIDDVSLLRIQLKTGRMHQARVHAQLMGHPILGDDFYGDWATNKRFKPLGVGRCLLHASSYAFTHPLTGEKMKITAPMPDDIKNFLTTVGIEVH